MDAQLTALEQFNKILAEDALDDIVELPCGCNADLNAIEFSLCGEAAKCPWCDVAFDAIDICEYIFGAEPPRGRGRSPRKLIRLGDAVLEILSHAGETMRARLLASHRLPPLQLGDRSDIEWLQN